MISKILAIAALLSSISAQDPHKTNSYAYYNENQNSVKHIEVAPAITRYAGPSAPIYSIPVQAKVAIPVIAKYAAPSASSYFSASAPAYAAPVAKVAIPVAAKFVAASGTYAAPLTNYASAPSHHQEEYAHPKYEYAYSIEDQHTGDAHSQQEQRDGDHVVGQYSLHEADGTVRIVKYYDDGHGFNAVVERQGTPTEAPAELKKIIAPVAVAAPHY